MNKLRIGIDMDGVIANLHSEWVNRYNHLYNDSLQVSDIDSWNWHEKTVPECQEKLYEILDDPDLFLHLPVIESSQEVLQQYNKEFDFWIVTAAWNPLNIPAKHSWLLKNFPFLNPKKFMFVPDKSGFNGDILIDDKVANLETFKGAGILFSAPHNVNENRFVRANNWNDVADYFDQLLFWRRYDERTSNGTNPRPTFNLLH